jgi:3'-phosphoadenosine 5'-phosphosulfate sulfotransferase (PAPS reductase)/FAD synthetase
VPRRRMFLDMNCVDAARERIRHVYDTFDTVCVQFSGGKDSTACLYLAKEIHEERGLGPVKVIFRDEEMLSPAVEDYVKRVSEYDWIDMEWYCLPQGQELWVLGRRQYVLLWSKNRERSGRLFRPFPEQALRAEHFGLDPEKAIPRKIDEYTMHNKKGRTAFITGIRANESMIRYRTVTQKLHENYINRPFKLSKAIPMRFAKVIYDWTSDDVLKFIHEEHGGDYCAYYDWAAMSGSNQRVGIPLHSVAARRLSDVLRTEPEFYDELYRCFPSIEAQRQLWSEFDIEAAINLYAAEGWKGVKHCIDDNVLTPGLHRAALVYANNFKKKHANDAYGFPIDNLIRTLLLNSFMGSPDPVGPKTKAHNKRVALLDTETQRLMDADSLDIQDDTR